MDTIRVIHDPVGRTLTIWVDDPSREQASAMDEHGVVVMKDRDDRVIGIEILNFTGTPSDVSLDGADRAGTTRR